MANKNLLNANADMLQADSYNVGQDIANQFGSVMKGYTDFKKQLNEDAMEASENLDANAVGVDLMSEDAQGFITTEFDNLGMEIARARADGNKQLVRKLEMQGADLISQQANIGNMLKDHAENKLSNNYSKSASTDMMDLLIKKEYTLEKDAKGKLRIKFNGEGTPADYMLTGFSNDPALQEAKIAEVQAQIDASTDQGEKDELEKEIKQLKGKGLGVDWQAEGILVSDLDKHIRLKDDSQGDVFNSHLDKIAKGSSKGGDFSTIKNETTRVVKESVETTDQLQTGLYDKSFMQDGKTLAEVWAQEMKDGKIKDVNGKVLDPQFDNPNAYLRSNGKHYKENEKILRSWMENKLMTAAENHHNNNPDTSTTASERNAKQSTENIQTYFNSFDQGQEPSANELLRLSNSNTQFKVVTVKDPNTGEDVRAYQIMKYSSGEFKKYKTVRLDTPQDILEKVFADALK